MEECLAFAKSLAKEAREIALKYFEWEVKSTWKEDNTPLTVADTAINDLVIKRISEAFPEHSIYGEEKSEIKEGSKYIWVCDPIDGTMAFSNGLPFFTFSIALVEQATGLPIVGLVNDPVMKNMYWASKGGGAFRNGKTIQVLPTTNLTNTYLSTEASGRNLQFSNLPLLSTLSAKNSKL